MKVTRRRFLVGLGVAGASGISAVAANSWAWRYSALGVGYTTTRASYESLALDAYETAVGLIWAEAAARVTRGKSSAREQLEALQLWTHENVRPQYSAPSPSVEDNFYDIARRGFGYCDQLGHVFATLATLSGHDARLLFLMRADGSSPHTLAEIRVGDIWALCDPYFGAVLHDEANRLVTVEDVVRNPTILTPFAYDTEKLTADLFGRGVRFRTFPYDTFGDFVARLGHKLTGGGYSPLRSTRPTPQPQAQPLPQSQAQPQPVTASRASGTTGLTDAKVSADILTYDIARRAHLEGRYTDAIDQYAQLKAPLDPDLGKATRFHVGLAYLRSNNVQLSKASFDLALELDPNSDWATHDATNASWAPSILFFRAEARERLGDHQGSVADLRAANIPPAVALLRSLHLQP
jgi:tetratricopeptide (TPR) repeat protein